MSIHLIIVAAGKGCRFGNDIPKQFLPLNGAPILFHAFRAFSKIKNIKYTLVLSSNYIDYWKELCNEYGFSIPHNIIEGGETRFHSVKNALQFIPNNSIVMIHDSVRPFPSFKTITNVIEKAESDGCAIPVIDVNDSIRQITLTGNNPVDRKNIKLIQTPQAFFSDNIKKAYSCDFNEIFTDDSIVYENAGNKICLVEGNIENIKITHQIDMIVAEGIIKNVENQ